MMAGIWASVNETLMITSVIFALFGLRLIRAGKRTSHRRMMILSAFFGGAFFLSYLLSTVIVGHTSFGGPVPVRPYYKVLLHFHEFIASSAALLGLSAIWFSTRGHFARHRRVAPWAAAAWFIAAGTGLAVYLLLFVLFPAIPNTPHAPSQMLSGSGQ